MMPAMTTETREVAHEQVEVAGPALLETLSPSRAGDFKVCPQLFKFKAIDRIPVPPTVHQARGTTAHLALQRLFDHPADDRTPQRLYDLFRDAWAELKPTEFPDLFDDLHGGLDAERCWGIESLEILANYFRVEDPGAIEPVGRELDLREDLGDITIRGILDRVEEGPAGLVITDYKTGKAPPERYAIPAFFALKIYGVLVRKHLERAPVALRLLYLNGPTVYEIAVTDAQLDAMERQLDALWERINRAIVDDHFPTRPGRLCDWCQYRDRCPAFAAEVADALAPLPGEVAGAMSAATG
jgi:putative RecB family exonuclease